MKRKNLEKMKRRGRRKEKTQIVCHRKKERKEIKERIRDKQNNAPSPKKGKSSSTASSKQLTSKATLKVEGRTTIPLPLRVAPLALAQLSQSIKVLPLFPSQLHYTYILTFPLFPFRSINIS